MVKQRIQISLSEKQLRRLKRLSYHRDFSKSNLIAMALERFLDEQEFLYQLPEIDEDLGDLFRDR